MKIIGEHRLENYAQKNVQARKPIIAWKRLVTAEQWKTSSDIRRIFRSADFLSGNRVIFNLGGNNYRLVVAVVYVFGEVRIEWIGTHAEYSKMDFNN